ncbi:MAG: hypothetical protein WC809_08795 [Sinimarinibacterium sp.]
MLGFLVSACGNPQGIAASRKPLAKRSGTQHAAVMASGSDHSDVGTLARHVGVAGLCYFDAQLREACQLALQRWPLLQAIDRQLNIAAPAPDQLEHR